MGIDVKLAFLCNLLKKICRNVFLERNQLIMEIPNIVFNNGSFCEKKKKRILNAHLVRKKKILSPLWLIARIIANNTYFPLVMTGNCVYIVFFVALLILRYDTIRISKKSFQRVKILIFRFYISAKRNANSVRKWRRREDKTASCDHTLSAKLSFLLNSHLPLITLRATPTRIIITRIIYTLIVITFPIDSMTFSFFW